MAAIQYLLLAAIAATAILMISLAYRLYDGREPDRLSKIMTLSTSILLLLIVLVGCVAYASYLARPAPPQQAGRIEALLQSRLPSADERSRRHAEILRALASAGQRGAVSGPQPRLQQDLPDRAERERQHRELVEAIRQAAPSAVNGGAGWAITSALVIAIAGAAIVVLAVVRGGLSTAPRIVAILFGGVTFTVSSLAEIKDLTLFRHEGALFEFRYTPGQSGVTTWVPLAPGTPGAGESAPANCDVGNGLMVRSVAQGGALAPSKSDIDYILALIGRRKDDGAVLDQVIVTGNAAVAPGKTAIARKSDKPEGDVERVLEYLQKNAQGWKVVRRNAGPTLARDQKARGSDRLVLVCPLWKKTGSSL